MKALILLKLPLQLLPATITSPATFTAAADMGTTDTITSVVRMRMRMTVIMMAILMY